MSIPRLLVGAGAAIVAAALVWWWTTYGDVVLYGYLSWLEAGRCLVRDSDLCSLAKVLCLGSHPRAVTAYWTSAFWLGVAILALSLLARPAPAALKKRRGAARLGPEEVRP